MLMLILTLMLLLILTLMLLLVLTLMLLLVLPPWHLGVMQILKKQDPLRRWKRLPPLALLLDSGLLSRAASPVDPGERAQELKVEPVQQPGVRRGAADSCQVCRHRHHSLLHPSGASGSNIGEDGSTIHEASSVASTSAKDEIKNCNAVVTAQAEGSSKSMVSCLSTGTSRKTVLLTTALIKAESKDGSYRVVRALLDQGSQGSFVTESTVQYLGLDKTPSEQVEIGVGGDKSATAKSSVTLTLRSRIDPSDVIRVNAFVLKSVSTVLPAAKVARVEWVDLTDDDLADPEYYRPNKIDVLLGAEVYSQVIQEGIKKNITGSLLAQNTKLGWILSGTFDVDQTINSSHITVMHSSLVEDDMLKKIYELEAEPPRKKMLTEEENKCVKLFAATTERDSNGRYIVRLPLRNVDPACAVGETRSIAEKRFKGLEVKFKKNEKLKEEYGKVIKEYLQLNHMTKVPEVDYNNEKAIYLPHHAVVREDKETSKARVVFDASCKGSKGMSLNDNMLVGPTLQADLRHTIIRWRTHHIWFVADIVKMYRQVLVHKKDTILQGILWRDDPEKEINKYQLKTVTFVTGVDSISGCTGSSTAGLR
ncbi:uncharacterized protein LOC113502705 [Trichoplusia ni]|uniref:Uncharacterized protein LOC113502705 n=1 Tax=Trichoplusia ni TaxID=7111 RepID=A0A7E5WIJ4_TRINI|nr:uncharacterized protein LOC113502705 [Trichoplusia ni]